MFFVSSSKYFMSYRLVVDSRMSRKCRLYFYAWWILLGFVLFYLCVCVWGEGKELKENISVSVWVSGSSSLSRYWEPTRRVSNPSITPRGGWMEYYTLSVLRNPFFFRFFFSFPFFSSFIHIFPFDDCCVLFRWFRSFHLYAPFFSPFSFSLELSLSNAQSPFWWLLTLVRNCRADPSFFGWRRWNLPDGNRSPALQHTSKAKAKQRTRRQALKKDIEGERERERERERWVGIWVNIYNRVSPK
jgi:hypothetical protein